MFTLSQILDLHRGAQSRRGFLRGVYGIEYKHFWEFNKNLRPPSQSLLLAIQRYHIQHFPQIPLVLLLTVSGIPARVILWEGAPPRRPSAEDTPAPWERRFERERLAKIISSI